MAERVGFELEVKPDRIDEYVAAHRDVWPEMLAAIKDAGIRNYTIFRSGTRVFGYFETDSREASERVLAAIVRALHLTEQARPMTKSITLDG